MASSNITNFGALAVNGIPVFGDGAGRDISGSTFFVDNNSGLDTNDGSSWEKALKTLARAVVLNNADIARGSDRWARRNTIYYAADTETATLVAFPNKCDVIGVGSYDANTQPGITGHHAPVNAGNYGTRFINIWFKAVAVASPIITLASSSSGIQFIGCTFDATAGTVTRAILATASPFLKVLGCKFRGAFATSYIAFGTGEAGGAVIQGNDMTGCLGLGISTAAGTTASWSPIVKGNFISAVGLIIDDDSSVDTDGCLYLVDNTGITGATLTNAAGFGGAFDANLLKAIGNRVTGAAGVCINYPTIIVA